jgi:hypothetical protein
MARTCFVGFILLAALCISASGQTLPMLHGRGEEWLSWTPMQRTTYVQGLADGYMIGFSKACELTDQLFEVGKPIVWETNTTRVVSVRCVPALRIDSEVIVTFRLGCGFDGVRQSVGDVPREEFLDAVDGVIGDASQHLV